MAPHGSSIEPAPVRESYRPISGSKLKLKCQLDRARSADLIEGVEAAALAPCAQIVIQHLRGLPELRGTEVVDRATEVRVIENVEEIISRLKRNPFCKAELPAQRQVPLRCPEAAESVASQIALSRSGNAECRCADDLASGCVWLVEVERHAGNNIRAPHAIRT